MRLVAAHANDFFPVPMLEPEAHGRFSMNVPFRFGPCTAFRGGRGPPSQVNGVKVGFMGLSEDPKSGPQEPLDCGSYLSVSLSLSLSVSAILCGPPPLIFASPCPPHTTIIQRGLTGIVHKSASRSAFFLRSLIGPASRS